MKKIRVIKQTTSILLPYTFVSICYFISNCQTKQKITLLPFYSIRYLHALVPHERILYSLHI